MSVRFFRWPDRAVRQKAIQCLGIFALSAIAYCGGRLGTLSNATAVPPTQNKNEPAPAGTNSAAQSDYSRRAVAYIYGNIMISREELGEYLIAREGAEKLEYLVNKRIIEHACKERGVVVTTAEIEQALAEDLKSLSVNIKDFEEKVLKQYKKSLFEWKEDVIRPKLAMRKLCRDEVKISQKDLEDAFQAYYGEKVKCRMIMYPAGEEHQAMKVYDKLRDSDEEFSRAARQQASPQLAAKAGDIPAFGWHTTGNDELERAAFSLKPGEVSQVIGTPQGTVILKCDAKMPPDTTKTLEAERPMLEKEIFEKKITQQAIPGLFQKLREQAKPKLFLQKYRTEEDWLRDIQQDLAPQSNIGDKAKSPAPEQK